MTQQPDPTDAPPALPALKIVEPEVDPDDPWRDDVLERKAIADRLTSIVRGQEAPFVISVDGRWGTGKTFLLKRWQQDLENQGWQAIYFNAWEDDFNDDPLLAIVGQLSEHFDEGAADRIAQTLAHAALNIVVKRLAGMKVDELTPQRLLDDYRGQQEAKRTVKDELARLGHRVRADTYRPLVFIIDELDRCRPTFAIELLERVKHIFDVPNIVFVFGINRRELVKSLESVYGEIDAGTYLRRFFDMEFLLPDASPLVFCRSLVPKYGLDTFFDGLSQRSGRSHSRELSMIVDSVAVVMGSLGLELRDIDYCVRLLSLAANDLGEGETLNPPLFALLVAMKIENPSLYRRFMEGNARAAEIIDHLNERHERGADIMVAHLDNSSLDFLFRRDTEVLARIEAAAYMADEPNVVRTQLQHLLEGQALDRPECLASDTAQLSPETDEDRTRLRQLMDFVREWSGDEERSPARIRADIGKRIDLYFGWVRR